MGFDGSHEVPYHEAKQLVDELVTRDKVNYGYFESMVPHDGSTEGMDVGIVVQSHLIEGTDETVVEYQLEFPDGGLVGGETEPGTPLYNTLEDTVT